MAELPSEFIAGATLCGNEYGWPIALFPGALQNAEALKYACIGGQFQFRVEEGIYEMYWLSADSEDRKTDESWIDYCQRSCQEVLEGFQKILAVTDFRKEASQWELLNAKMNAGADIGQSLVFVAYFVDESEAVTLRKMASEARK